MCIAFHGFKKEVIKKSQFENDIEIEVGTYLKKKKKTNRVSLTLKEFLIFLFPL